MNLELVTASILLTIVLIVGIIAGRGVNDLKSYAVSKNFFNSFSLTCTIVASFIGGAAIIGTAEKAFSQGIAPVVGWLGFSVQIIFIARYVAPRIANFSDTISVGDIIKRSYGKGAKVITGIFWVLFCTGIITAQASAMGRIIDIFSSFSPFFNTIIGLGIVVSYCFLGGIRSVVATDIIQFIVMFIALPITVYYSVTSLGGLSTLISQIPMDYYTLGGSVPTIEVLFLFLSFIFGDAFIPPMMQRLVMASKTKQAQQTLLISALLIIPLCFMGGILGITIYSINPSLDSGQVIPFLFNEVLSDSVKAIAILGLLSIIMSSADSYLNSASIALVHDVIRPLANKKISKTTELKLARLTTIVIGVTVIMLSAFTTSILDLLTSTFKLWGPTIMLPLGAVIFDIKLPKITFYLTVIVGMSTVAIWDSSSLYNLYKVDGLIPGVIASFAVCYMSYLRHNKK